MTLKEAQRLLRELLPMELERLRAKAEWEKMAPVLVIREWGDPRQW